MADRHWETEPIFVGVGTSLGDRLAQVAFAAQALSAQPGLRLVAGSWLYDTAPAGGVARQRFVNGVLQLLAEPPWAPEPLLDALLAVETAAGRTRKLRWEDRVLDLDLLLYGARMAQTPRLTLPHPHLHERRFVLAPLCDLAPHLRHPTLGRTMAELLADLGPDAERTAPLAPEDHPGAWPPRPSPSV